MNEQEAHQWAGLVASLAPAGLTFPLSPGEVALLGDLHDPAGGRRRVVEELLETVGAERGLDPDLWAITTDQAAKLLELG